MHEMQTFTLTLCLRIPRTKCRGVTELRLLQRQSRDRLRPPSQRPHRQPRPCAMHGRALPHAPRSHVELARLRCAACRHRSRTPAARRHSDRRMATGAVSRTPGLLQSAGSGQMPDPATVWSALPHGRHALPTSTHRQSSHSMWKPAPPLH